MARFEVASPNVRRVAKAAFWCLVLVSITALVMPLNPAMPGQGLDPSWGFGMNQAVAQGLAIGSEVLFTFGPYASVYTQIFHPQTDGLMLFGSVSIALALAAAFWAMRAVREWPFALALLAVLAGAVTMPDTLFFAYLLIAGLSILTLVESQASGPGWRGNVILVLVMIPFGLLPLIKGSFLVLALPVCLLSAALLLVNRRFFQALLTIVVPAGAVPVFWSIAGQPMGGLPDYLATMVRTVSGYSEAMALNGTSSEIVWFLAGAFVLLLASALDVGRSGGRRSYLCLLLAGYLFVVFKAGFVRHDFHALVAGSSLFVAALAINVVGSNLKTILSLCAAFAVWLHIDGHYFGPTAGKFADELGRHFVALLEGGSMRATSRGELERRYHERLSELARQSGFPKLGGTTDIYSYNQSFLIASGNAWNPRPVFQSYAAYSPDAAQINRRHLLGPRAPDNILFGVEPIDTRFPATEDGLSWPVLLERYMPVSGAGNALVLRRMDGFVSAPVQDVGVARHRLGQWVELPATGGLLHAQFDIRSTMFGKLAGVAFKPSQLKIEVILENGMRRAYRLVSGMARSSFLLSPLIDNTREFALLYGAQDQLARKRIRRFMISAAESDWMWEPEYELRLTLTGALQ